MPRGMLTRLIVRLNQLIYQETQWYYGVLLEWGGTRALLARNAASGGWSSVPRAATNAGCSPLSAAKSKPSTKVLAANSGLSKRFPATVRFADTAEPHFYVFSVLQSKLETGKTEVTCDRRPHHDVKIQRLISDVFLSEREEEEFEQQQRGIRAENYYEQHFHEVGTVVQGDEIIGHDKVAGDKVGVINWRGNQSHRRRQCAKRRHRARARTNDNESGECEQTNKVWQTHQQRLDQRLFLSGRRGRAFGAARVYRQTGGLVCLASCADRRLVVYRRDRRIATEK